MVLGAGYWVPGSGFWVLGSGFWVLGCGRHMFLEKKNENADI